MTINFTPATLGDIEGLLALENQVFSGDKLSRRSFRSFIKKANNEFIIAHHQERLIGYVLVLYRARSQKARIYSIAIDATMQGMGVGSSLLEHAENAAREKNKDWMVLEVRPDNSAARAFYDKKGYVYSDTKPNFYQDGADALRLVKPLQ